jgi:hypothetical protein
MGEGEGRPTESRESEESNLLFPAAVAHTSANQKPGTTKIPKRKNCHLTF